MDNSGLRENLERASEVLLVNVIKWVIIYRDLQRLNNDNV